VFFMRNQAVGLSKMDLSLVVIGQEAMDKFAKLCNHSFMQNKIKMTMPARRKHDDLNVLLQYLILRDRPEMGFSGTEIMGFCDDIKSGEVNINADEISAVLDYLDRAILSKRAYLKKVHVPLVMHVANAAMKKGMIPAEFASRLDGFFANMDADSEYMAACQSGSAKRTNVQLRLRIIGEILNGPAAVFGV